MKKRRRFKQTASLARLCEEAERLKLKAARMTLRPRRTALLAKARQMNEAAEMTDFLAAPKSAEASQTFSGGHSGQVSPIELRTSRTSATASSAEGSAGGS